MTRSFVSAGNDLPVVRIIAFDQFRNEQRVVEIERDLAAADADFHFAIVGQEALQFRDRFGRHDDVGLVAARKFQFDVDHGQAPAIRGDERELVFLQAKQDAVQNVTRFVGRNRVGGLAQSIAQILLPNRDHLRAFKFRQRRKLFFGQPEDLEKALAAADRSRVLPIDFDLNFARRQLADDGEEPPRRQGGGAFLLDVRFETAAHAHIQIGRGEMDFAALRLEQDVGENRQVVRVLTTFCTCCKPSSNFSFVTLNFIGGRARCKACGFFGNRNLAAIRGVASGRRRATQRCRELSMNEMVWRMLSCSSIRFFTSLQACRTVP